MSRSEGGSRLWTVVFWIAIVVFVCSMCGLGYIFYSYWSADKGYQNIAQQAFEVNEDATTLADMTVDWDYLRSVNPDVVAWVYLPGTNINYPVVQGENNDVYLGRDFNQKDGFSARCGTIFLDSTNNPEFKDDNSVLYGHHMNDGSMFASISKQLTDNDEFNANRYVYVLTPTCNYKCETFALVLTDGWDALVETNFMSDIDRIEYIEDKQGRSVVQPTEGMPDPASIKKMIAFSTCDYTKNNGRAVLFAQVVAASVPGSSGISPEVSQEDIDAMRESANAA